MPRLSAAPIILTPAQAEETACPGAQDAAQAGRTGRDDPALGSRDGGARDCPPAWRLAEDGAPLARLLAGQRSRYAGDSTAGGCIPAGGTGDIHARTGLRHHGTGLRTAGAERSAAQPLEPERVGPRGGQAWHRRQYLARFARAVFKQVPTSSHIPLINQSTPLRPSGD